MRIDFLYGLAHYATNVFVTGKEMPASDNLITPSIEDHSNAIIIFYSLCAVAVASALAKCFEWFMPPALYSNPPDVALLFMVACAFVGGRFGMLAAAVAVMASFIVVNYFFTASSHILTLGTVSDVINTLLFLSSGFLIAFFTSQTRNYAKAAALKEIQSEALFTLYRTASEAFSHEQILDSLHSKLEQILNMDVAFFLPFGGVETHLEPALPKTLTLTEEDRKALNQVWKNMGVSSNDIISSLMPLAVSKASGCAWYLEPMIASAGRIGIIGFKPRNQKYLGKWAAPLTKNIAAQIAAMLEHINMEQSIKNKRVNEERENLRTKLLSSISHDFKTPIAGIIGALSVHLSLGERLSQTKRNELIESAIEEAQRLDSFITNIIDMSRLESGTITFKQEWHDIESVFENVTKRIKSRLRHHELVFHPVVDAIEICMDPMMTGQVLQNILDNACKYTQAGTRIEINCELSDNGFFCNVHDYGKGIPPEKLEHIFDKYARLNKKDSQIAGTGLGLAICKAIMEAQNGWIKAANHPAGGAVFTFCLPRWRKEDTGNAERASV